MSGQTGKAPRIPYADPAQLEPDIRSFVEQGRLNVIRLMAGASPDVVRTLQQFSYSFYQASPLPADLREVAILQVGYLSGSAYEVHQHIVARENSQPSDRKRVSVDIKYSILQGLGWIWPKPCVFARRRTRGVASNFGI